MNSIEKYTLILISSLSLGLPACANQATRAGETERQQSKEVSQEQKEHSQKQSMKVPVKSISGEIAKIKKVSVKGSDMKNVVILLETEKGKRVVTDLGTDTQFSDLDLKVGSKVSVRGFPTRIGDRFVVIADRLTMDGNTVNIEQRTKTQG